MKRAIRWTWLVFVVAILMPAALPAAWGASSTAPETSMSMAGYLENVTFEKLPGKERVTLAVSKQSGVTVENQPGNAVVVRLENLFVPEGLRRPLGDAVLANVVSVTPVQQSTDGRSWVLATIELKRKVPYSVRQEGMNVLIDFNVASLASAGEPVPEKPSPTPTVQPMLPKGAAIAPMPVMPEKDTAKIPTADAGKEKKVYSGPRVSLDVQDADINKVVFRLLAELGKVSIVAGDDVKGTVTLHMTDVPWEQALDTVLDLKGLEKKREGNIIKVITLDRKKKDEADRIAVETAQLKAEDERKVREQKQNVEQGKLKQIAIEAKIVEVDTNFTRELGIRWGYGYKDSWQGRDIGMLIGNSDQGDLTSLPSGIGLTKSNTAVNFPSLFGATSTGVMTPGLGLILGSSQFILDAKLSALENSGDGRIISSPKVTTLENEKAEIWQGKKVPVVTPGTSTNPPTVRYEDADLRLTVTPKITADKERISMVIEASNKEIDNTNVIQGNPAINTSGVTSKIVVRDGDTIVVGGVFKTNETFAKDAVPWLSEIPLLGWLFKYETKNKITREMLVFITPRIITEGQ